MGKFVLLYSLVLKCFCTWLTKWLSSGLSSAGLWKHLLLPHPRLTAPLASWRLSAADAKTASLSEMLPVQQSQM